MAEATPVNVQAFEPYGGGDGVRLAATSVSSSGPIPGLSGGQQGDASRVTVSNSGNYPACVRMGAEGVEATLASYEILPGVKELLKPPFVGPKALWIAAITESGTTTIKVCAGQGT